MHKHPIDLRRMATHAAFGSLAAPAGRDRVLELFGAPDNFGANPRNETHTSWQDPQTGEWHRRIPPNEAQLYHAKIWWYGSIEIYFDSHAPAAQTTMVFSDNFHEPLDGGGQLELDPWLLLPGLSLQDCQARCAAEGLACTLAPYCGQAMQLTFASGFELFFDRQHETDPLQLDAFTLWLGKRPY